MIHQRKDHMRQQISVLTAQQQVRCCFEYLSMFILSKAGQGVSLLVTMFTATTQSKYILFLIQTFVSKACQSSVITPSDYWSTAVQLQVCSTPQFPDLLYFCTCQLFLNVSLLVKAGHHQSAGSPSQRRTTKTTFSQNVPVRLHLFWSNLPSVFPISAISYFITWQRKIYFLLPCKYTKACSYFSDVTCWWWTVHRIKAAADIWCNIAHTHAFRQ